MSYITNVITTLKSFYPEMFRMTWSKRQPGLMQTGDQCIIVLIESLVGELICSFIF